MQLSFAQVRSPANHTMPRSIKRLAAKFDTVAFALTRVYPTRH